MPAQLFSHYSCPWVRRAFGLQFGHFVDMLHVFALGSGAELVLRFPGPDEELICEYGSCPCPMPAPVCMSYQNQACVCMRTSLSGKKSGLQQQCQASCDAACRMSEEGNVAQLCTHAHISTAEVPFAGDLMDAWEEPSSHFLMSGARSLQPVFTHSVSMLLYTC